MCLFNDGGGVSPGILKRSASFKYLWYIVLEIGHYRIRQTVTRLADVVGEGFCMDSMAAPNSTKDGKCLVSAGPLVLNILFLATSWNHEY